MKVSIIVPVYNVSAFIERCLDSVIAQSYTDIECILIDDGTPDDSIAKCQRKIDSYSGPIIFKILHHEHNRGLSAARNTGILAAKGKYIYFLDGDDYITPACIKLLITEALRYPKSEMICGGAEPDDKLYVTKKYKRFTNNRLVRLKYLSPQQEFPIPAWNKLVLRNFVASNELFFKEGIIHEDVLWTFQVIKKIQFVSLLPQTTYHYYQRDQSIIHATSDAIRAKSMMCILHEIAKNADEPYYLLAIFKFLLRLFDWFHFPTPFNTKTYLAFAIALSRKRKKLLALSCLCYFYFCPPNHGRRFGRNLREHIMNLYLKENEQQIIESDNGIN